MLVGKVTMLVRCALEKLDGKDKGPEVMATCREAMWQRVLARYGDDLAMVVHTVHQLGLYYAASDARVDLRAVWRTSTTKWEKILHSLAPRTFKMGLPEAKRFQFLADLLVYLFVCWEADAPVIKPKRNKRRKTADAKSAPAKDDDSPADGANGDERADASSTPDDASSAPDA